MRNGYTVGVLTSVDFCEIGKMKGEVCQIHEGDIY